MKILIRSAVVLLGAWAMSLLAADEAPAGAKPRHPLDGKWLVAELWEGGKQSPDEEAEKFHITFADGKVIAKMATEEEVTAGVSLDESKTPHWLTIQAEVDGQALTLPAIYEINNEVLKLCHPMEPGGARPASFDKAEGVVLVILKREPAVPAEPGKPVPAPTDEAKEKP